MHHGRTRMRRRYSPGRTVSVLAAAVCLLSAAGCSSGSSTAAVQSSTATSKPTGGSPTRKSPSPASSGPSSAVGGTDAPWQEDFDGAAGSAPDPALLTTMDGGNGSGNHELETYTSSRSNSGLDGAGHLVITARRQTFTGTDGYTRDWTSARLISLGRWAFTYGTLAARIKLPVGRGLWPAFWLVGIDVVTAGWPKCGEIDIVESKDDGQNAFHSLHGPTTQGAPWGIIQPTRRTSAVTAQYHEYSVERRPNKITFSIDGSVVSVLTKASMKPGQEWVFDKPMFIVLNVAVGGDWPKKPDATTPSTSSMSIDWLKFSP